MTDQKFTIREISESDLSEWMRLRMMLWDEMDEESHRTEMVDIIQNPESQFVAVADAGGGQLCGFLEASIRTHVEDCETENVGYLEGWFVEEEYRRLGVGRQLVAYAEMWARRKGCTEMASDAEIDNIISLTAHTNLGYVETSRLVHLRKELV